MSSPTPIIEIHLAHDIDVDDELSPGFEIRPLRSPYSPKFPSPMAYTDSDADDFRPVHLLPPPTAAALSPVLPRVSTSPPADKKGIDEGRFNELLKNSRERSATKFGHARKDSAELRRQATLKAHTAKALERRALFLTKISQAPSASATESPATPPESPAIFHFTLPSPGLQSPLSIAPKRRTQPAVAFPSENKPVGGWVEEVDFKARARTNSIRNGAPLPHSRSHGRRASAHALPSLDQITARLAKSNAPSMTPPPNDLAPMEVSSKRPPLRLVVHKRSPSSPLATVPTPAIEPVVEPVVAKATAGGNRLPAFLQKRSASPEAQLVPPTPTTPSIVISAPTFAVPEVSVVPTQPSVEPIVATRRRYPLLPMSPAQPLMSRSTSPLLRPTLTRGRPATPETRKQRGLDMVEKLRRRSSAPAALPALAKDDHPVLKMKGGF